MALKRTTKPGSKKGRAKTPALHPSVRIRARGRRVRVTTTDEDLDLRDVVRDLTAQADEASS